MESWTSRTELLLGKERLDYLQSKHVLIVGVGGVGAYAAEMVCRAGIGKITIVDGDTVQPSNINRQLIALHSTIQQPKVEVLKQRLLDINPKLILQSKFEYLQDECIPKLLDADSYDFVIDSIDTIAPKVLLISHALMRDLKIVSSMGAGGKTDPTKVSVADIANTYHCSLAKVIRKRLRHMQINRKLPVVFSSEPVNKEAIVLANEKHKKSTVGTISYMPAIFGCYLASYVIRNL